MKHIAIVGTAALAALLLGPAGAAAGESDKDKALFGKDPGQARAYACYVRRYDAAHLQAHPDQNVRDMLLFVHSSVEGDSGRQYSLEMGVRFRAAETQFRVSGGCSSSSAGESGLNCSIDCDGGTIDVRLSGPDALLVSIPYGAATWDPDSEATPPEGARFGKDDELFRLERTGLNDCLPIVSDEEQKAEIAAGM